jgi:hypothetical protein
VPMVVASFYWIYLINVLVKMLIARDLSQTPQPPHFWLLFAFPFYLLWLRIPVMYAEFCEMVRIGAQHPYVPDHVWQEIPWW